MKYILMFALIFVSSAHAAITGQELVNISKQYQNRNWGYHSALYARQAHLIDYTETSFLKASKEIIGTFLDELASTPTDYLALFYPESNIVTDNDKYLLSERYGRTYDSYDVLIGWSSFLDAIDTERWEDTKDEEGKVIPGRQTKGEYAVNNLTSYQRQSLSVFKQIVLDELDLIESEEFDLPVGPGSAKVFQFLFDNRAIDKLLKLSYFKVNDHNQEDLQKINGTEIGRALIVQIFQGNNGELVNSDLVEIRLEDSNCYLSVMAKSGVTSCQYDYIKNLIWDRNNTSNAVVKNLIFDPKGIKPFLDALVLKYSKEDQYSVTLDRMKTDLYEKYLILDYVYGLDPVSSKSNLPILSEHKRKAIIHLKASIEYLINKRNIIGLQVARGLQQLIVFFEGEV